MSAAVPFLFTPVPLHDRITGEKVVMADGAMAANYPIGVVPRGRPILGFRLVPDQNDHLHQPVAGPLSLARSVVIAGIRARYSLPRHIASGATVIQVPVSDDLDFEMSNEEARRAFDRGRSAARKQLSRLDPAAADHDPDSTWALAG